MEKEGIDDPDKIEKEQSALQDHIFQLAFEVNKEPEDDKNSCPESPAPKNLPILPACKK